VVQTAAFESSGNRDGELAQAIIPFQRLSQGVIFSPQESLQKGTIFSALYRPYEANKIRKK
jgi:hypothetical protein